MVNNSNYKIVWDLDSVPDVYRSDTGSTYTPWWYDYYEEEEESSSHPVLWLFGGLILGAVLTVLAFYIIRKKKLKNMPLNPQANVPAPAAVPQDPDEREAMLRKRAYATDRARKDELEFAGGSWAQTGSGMFPSAENRLVEVRSAEMIPGETLPMLATRLHDFLGCEGVNVDITDIGKILAAYTCCGSVRMADLREIDPTLLKRATRALSEFFCASMPGSPDPAADYLPADPSVPKHVSIVIKMTRLPQAERRAYGGINRETFRGILHEAEEELFIPEEDWKRVDILLSHYTGTWFMPERHLTIKNVESTCTCLLAVGATADAALDYALYQNLFLRVYRKLSRSGMTVLCEAFDNLFAGRNMPICQEYLAEYRPEPSENETPATKNQTTLGGEYEPV